MAHATVHQLCPIVDGESYATSYHASKPVEQNVKIGPSSLGPNAGEGLFCQVHLPKHTIIGNYSDPSCSLHIPWYDKHYVWVRLAQFKDVTLEYARRYSYSTQSQMVIVPMKHNLLRYINDAIDLDKLKTMTKEQKRIEYYEETGDHVSKYNVDWMEDKNNNVYIVTTRDVHPGDELFIAYGYDYWRRHIMPS